MIKEEPHKLKKLESGALRLIYIFSLEDQMVDRILFYTSVQKEIKNVARSVCKTGWSPLPEGYRLFDMAFRGDVFVTDNQQFDWTLPEWVVKSVLDSYLLHCPEQDPFFPAYEKAVRTRYNQVLGRDCIIRFPNGRRVRQDFVGFMKSGWLLTISKNSAAQYHINTVAWQRTGLPGNVSMWAMGDDVVMQWPESCQGKEEELVKNLESLGVVIKQYSHDREFAGFSFGTYLRPLYVKKHLFNLRYTPGELLSEVAMAYNMLYAKSDDEYSAPVLKPLQPYNPWPRHVYKAWAEGLPVRGLRPDLSHFQF